MHDQLQSSFFAQLPAEIRTQIQVEYLADHLRSAAITNFDRLRGRGSPVTSRFIITHDPPHNPDLSSTVPSPLSRTCRRMYDEMIHDLSPYGPSRLAVFCVARNGDSFSNQRFALAVEGCFDWDRVRRLRFVNEQDHPNPLYWKTRLGESLTSAFQLVLLEIEFSPEMSIVRIPMDEELLQKIKEHPKLKAIKIRGNVPKAWIEALRGLPGKEVVIEPIWWTERAPEEDEEMDRKKVEEGEKAQAELNQYYTWQDEAEKKSQERGKGKKGVLKKQTMCQIQ